MDKQYRYEEIKEYFDDAIKNAEKTDNALIKRIVLFSILDSIVQEYNNYSGDDNKIFEKFICEFSTINYLDKYDPITIYYEMKNELDSEIESNLDYLEDAYNYSAEQMIELDGSKQIIDEANKKGIKIYRHTFAQLIYKYRCKLVHEFRILGVGFNSMEKEKNINYISEGFLPDIRWRINIPYTFLKNLTNECINNYLTYCKNKKRDPYENAKEYSFWYEK